MRPFIKYSLHFLLALLVSSFLIVIVFGAFLLFKPDSIINERTLNWARRLTPRFGFKVNWNEVDVEAESLSLFHKRFAFEFDGLCVQTNDEANHFCFDQYILHFQAAYQDGKFILTSLGPFIATEGDILVTIPKSEAKKEKKPEEKSKGLKIPELIFPPFLRDTDFHQVYIDLDDIEIKTPQKTYKGSLTAFSVPTEDYHLNELHLAAKLQDQKAETSGEVFLQMLSPSGFTEDIYTLKTNSTLKLKGNKQLDLNGIITKTDEKKFSYNLSSDFSSAKLNFELDTEGSYSKEKKILLGTLHGRFDDLADELPRIDIKKCNYNLEQISEEKNRGQLYLSCPANFYVVPPIQTPTEYNQLARVPNQFAATINIQAKSFFLPDFSKDIAGQLTINLHPIPTGLIIADGQVFVDFKGNFSKNLLTWDYNTIANILLTIPEFQNVVKRFHYTQLAIPAPFHVLKGKLTTKIQTRGNPLKRKEKFQIELSSHLQSQEQQLDLEGKGEMQIRFINPQSRPEIDAEIKLTQVQLALPHIEIAKIPQFFPDKRIKDEIPPNLEYERKSIPLKGLSHKISIVTQPDQPARVLSHYVKNHIPIDLNILIHNGEIKGTVTLKKFEFSVLRRNAQVEKLRIALKHPKSQSEIDGILAVKYTDYDIKLILLGNFERPRVIFQSTPPLPREDIIALLLYGRTFEETDTTEENSISSVIAAMADRAISLTTLLTLSSTPIKSISYNPTTKLFQARVQLREGTSLTIGTGAEDYHQLGLRQSLGKNFLIRTYVDNPFDGEKQVGNAFIEWSKRY